MSEDINDEPDDDDESVLSTENLEQAEAALEDHEGPVDMVSLARDGSDSGLRADYDDEMDRLERHATDRGVKLDDVSEVYRAALEGNRHLTSHEQLMERTDFSYHRARQATAVLSDMGDFHECYDEDWSLWWVRCDRFIKDKCEERRISLHRYFEMHDLLIEFQDKVVEWYVRRNRRQQQPFQLRSLKEQYVHKIQREYFPEKPVGDEWSRHIAARYLRTAQDSIVRSMDLTY